MNDFVCELTIEVLLHSKNIKFISILYSFRWYNETNHSNLTVGTS